MLFSFLFNGIKKDYLICERGKRRSAFAPKKRNLLTIPGMPGAYLESTDTEVRIIEQPIVINGKDRFDVRKWEEDLADWLITEEAVELIFEDEPERIYYAVVDGSLNIEDIARFGRGTITFICPDPYKYGEEDTIGVVNGLAEINNAGTAESKPIITAEVLKPITYLNVISDDAYMQLGKPVQIGQTPAEEKTRLFWSEANTFFGWSDATSVDGAAISGTMSTDGFFFYASDFGTHPTLFHGPAKKAALSESIQDFQLEILLDAYVDNLNHSGRIEVALLDALNKQVGKVMFWRPDVGTQKNYAMVMAGNQEENHIIVDEHGDHPSTWTEFTDGIMRLSRKGNEWEAYIAIIRPNGMHDNIRYRSFVDVDNKFMNQVTQVQVFIGRSPHVPPMIMRIHDVKVYRWNANLANQIPYIAQPGDIIEINHQTDDIRINGESRLIKTFGSSFFPLKKGINSLIFNPSDALNAVVKWRPRYK